MRVPIFLGLSLITLHLFCLQEPSSRQNLIETLISPLAKPQRQVLERKIFVPHTSLPILTVAIVKDPRDLVTEIYKHDGSQLVLIQRLPLGGARRLAHFQYQGRPQTLQMLDQNQDGFGDLLVGLVTPKGENKVQKLLWNSQTHQFEGPL
jgi:hypothetical protein